MPTLVSSTGPSRLGLLEADNERLRVPSPRLLHAGAELYAAGVPIEAVLGHARALRRDIERIAQRFLRLTAEHVLDRYLRTPDEELSDDDLSALVEVVRRLRPLAQMAVDAELARAMERLTLALRHRPDGPSGRSGPPHGASGTGCSASA